MTRSSNRRRFLQMSGSTAAAALTLRPRSGRAASPMLVNDQIRLAFLSCGGRANELMGAFEKVPGLQVVGLCDPDPARVSKAKMRFPQAKTSTDLRTLIDDDQIDAVVVATCNHWHCLAAIWAMQAGKDVYVEKPLSHSQWEGEQTVAAARKYNRICQVGTQQRSDPMQDQIKAFLHEEKGIGPLQRVRVNRYGVRGAIGKRSEPLPADPNINRDLWLGPAADLPIYRNQLHYDWHWDWNTGSGEMGNWGVHVLDDVRNVVFRDSVAAPRRILGAGGRVVWDDAGQTPNVHCVAFDTGTLPVVIGLSNLPGQPGQSKSPDVPGPSSGYVVYAEGGRLEGQRGGAKAFDSEGKVIREFRGNSGAGHQANFIEAVRQRDPKLLKAEVQVGHDSTGWCNLANICYQSGSADLVPQVMELGKEHPGWSGLVEEIHQHLTVHQVPIDHPSLRMSRWMELDPATGRFTGEHAEEGNRWWKRVYRAPYEVPEIV
jgi:predicted dehydrogenase